MFAKLSTLALFVSFASALQLSVPLTVEAGAGVVIDVATIKDDPAQVGVMLIGTDLHVDLAYAVDVTAYIYVDIPVMHVHPGPGYVIAAVEVGNPSVVYAQSNKFEIEAAAH